MKPEPIHFEGECESCGHKQEITLHVTKVEVKGEDPDRFINGLIDFLKKDKR